MNKQDKQKVKKISNKEVEKIVEEREKIIKDKKIVVK